MNIDKEKNKKVLIIAEKPFYPENEDGITKINFNLLKNNSEIDFLSFIDINHPKNNPLSNKFIAIETNKVTTNRNKFLRLFSLTPLPVFKTDFKEALIKKTIQLESQYDVLFFSGPQMVPILEKMPHAVLKKSIISLIDSMSLYWKRRADCTQFIPLKVLYYIEFFKAVHFEKYRASKAEVIHFVSSVDLDFSKNLFSPQKKLISITNGVHFNCVSEKKELSPYRLLFVGNYSYGPNLDAARFLILELMPELKITNSLFNLTLVGPHLPESLVKNLPTNTTYLGFVKNVETVYDTHSVFLSPLSYGSGIKNKILEAMAKGLIVIGTDLSFDNIPIENEGHALVMKNLIKDEWIKKIISLIDHKYLITISKHSQELVNSQFTWKAKSNEYTEMFNGIQGGK
jgi:glycosyltransferase involved in cell wall biosynthesis